MVVNNIAIRELWSKEQPIYERYGIKIKNEVESLLKQIGIYGEVSFRTKEPDSLIKKLYRKSKPYEEIHDKVGARAVVQFKNNLYSLDQKICEYYGARIKNRDDKAKSLSEYEFGYQSIHYDISNCEGNMFCELQVRTVCQHNWSMMSHSLAYKKEKDIPVEIKRKINALSALFEIADTQFQSICDSIAALPETHEIYIMNWLESRFYSMCTCEYDHEMTNDFMKIYPSLYNDENAVERLSSFYEQNFENLKRIISSHVDNVFYTQPEILIILERLTNKKIYFKTKWAELYPIELLEEIANVWGMSIE